MKRTTTGWIGIAVVLVALGWPASSALSMALPMPGPADAAPPTLLCDGTPPELVNTDTTEHAYKLTCGKKVEDATIPAATSQSLEGKSGCVLELGDNEATKLHTEMICTIAAGKLGCDLF